MQPRFSTREIILSGLFAGIVAVMSLIPPIPLPVSPVPITAQTLGVMLAGSVLGARGGSLALFAFLFLVVAGAPVLATGHTGPGVFVGPTGGYVLSWPLAAYVVGWVSEKRHGRFWWYVVANVLGGIIVVYAVGVPVMAWVTGLSIGEALVVGALVFLPGDVIKAFVGAALAVSLDRVTLGRHTVSS